MHLLNRQKLSGGHASSPTPADSQRARFTDNMDYFKAVALYSPRGDEQPGNHPSFRVNVERRPEFDSIYEGCQLKYTRSR